MKVNSLEDMFLHELKDMFDAEKRLVRALPKIAKASHSDSLKEAFEEHLNITKNQVGRLEQVFGIIEAKPQGKPCAGMKGLIEEGEEIMEEIEPEALLDLALLGAARKVEHYEMVGYQSLISLAQNFAEEQIVELLQQNLQEEEEADQKLMELSEELMEMASGGEELEEDEEEDDAVGEGEDESEEDEEEEVVPSPARKRR